MSAPDPKAWEATGAEVWDISGADTKEAREIIAAVARRRAIEELKALRKFMRDYGFAAEYVVNDRIAAIEAEPA